MRATLALCMTLLALGGCTHQQLRNTTRHVEGTLTDLHYQQVLDNLALFVANPAALPYYAVISSGVVQVSDAGTLAYQFNNNPFGSPTGVPNNLFGLGGGRTVSAQWSLTPVHDPAKLAIMRCAYQMAVGAPLAPCDDCEKKVRTFFDKDYGGIPQGWFHAGGKRDVPDCAGHVGRYCDTYVWVTPEGYDALTKFALGILDVATVQSHVPVGQVTRTYDGAVGDGKLKTTEVRTTETVPVKPEPTPHPTTRDLSRPEAGLNFVPR